MQAYDFLMIAVLIGATIFGAWKGLAWQIASIASMVVSYLAALNFHEAVSPHIVADPPPWNKFIAMLAIFLVTSLAIWVLFRLVAGFIDRLRLKEFDRQLGAIFGLAKGVLFCVVITFFMLSLWPESRPNIIESHSGEYIARLIDKADAVMPHEIHDVLGPYLHEVERGLDKDANGDGDSDHYHGEQPKPVAAAIPGQ